MTELNEVEIAKQKVLAVYPESQVEYGEKGGVYAISNGGFHEWNGHDYYDYISDWFDSEDAAWIDAASRLPKEEPSLPVSADGMRNSVISKLDTVSCTKCGKPTMAIFATPSGGLLCSKCFDTWPTPSGNKSTNSEFLLGFAIALSTVNRQHDEPTIVKDAIEGNCLTIKMFKDAGVEEYDLKELRKCLK